MINIIITMIFPLVFLPVFIDQYSIIQSEHYEVNKYLIYKKNKKIIHFALSLPIMIIGLLFNGMTLYIMTIITIILNYLFYFNNFKIKFTNRVKRVLTIYFIFTYSICLFVNKIKLILVYNTMFLVYVLIIHFISTFIEKAIRAHYRNNARKIIKNKKVIGITGSYGKTSSKNIIYDMMSNFFNVSKTPKSFNTEIGIIKSIRENVDNFDEYFICEYGVDRVKGMDKLLKIVKPNICLITDIGPQHLLTFKSIENIRKEKIKLAKILKKEEVAIINKDNKYLRESLCELECNVITYGVDVSSDIMAKNIKVNKQGSSFDLYVKGEFIDNIQLNLLGEHNVSNVLGSIGVLMAINVDIKNIKNLVKLVKPVEHRLQLKKINDVNIIDDSFNSNEKGFKKAIDILNMMEEKRIVITPGIIEQGKNSKLINYELGKYMSDKIDVAILVETNALVIKQGLLDNGFNQSNIVIKKNFIEAWEYVKKIDENKIILIENDLPSIYLK